jgi:hypothetical protein
MGKIGRTYPRAPELQVSTGSALDSDQSEGSSSAAVALGALIGFLGALALIGWLLTLR